MRQTRFEFKSVQINSDRLLEQPTQGKQSAAFRILRATAKNTLCAETGGALAKRVVAAERRCLRVVAWRSGVRRVEGRGATHGDPPHPAR